jgi:hypothetical protein
MSNVPSRAPWLDHIRQTGRLAISFHDSLGKAGWVQVFKDAIVEFNKLSSSHQLGVTFVREDDPKKANVEARAARGNFKVEYPPDFPYDIPPEVRDKTIPFDGGKAHGYCKPLLTIVKDRAQVEHYKVVQAYIYVPAAPMEDRNGKPSPVGDPVKLVIAVHELIHACGLVDNKEHSVDDVFCWPTLRMGNKPSEDRVGTLGETYTFPGKPGEPDRVGRRIVEMPPIFLKKETADKVRKLWTASGA